MIENLSGKDKILMALYRTGVSGLREKLVRELPKRSAEWTELAGSVLKDPLSEERSMVFRQLMRPGFIEGHPNREALASSVAWLLTDGGGAERREAARFVADNLGLFPANSDAFQLKIMGLQHSQDPQMIDAAADILDRMGIDLRDPELLGDEHDSLQL